MSASYSTKLILAFRNGDFCAFPECGRTLTTANPSSSDVVVTGEAAHIEGEKPESPRYNTAMTDEQRNHYDNLIYLCGDHHTQIDKQSQDFSVAWLRDLKVRHEKTVRDAMNAAFAKVGFQELATVTEWISRIAANPPSTDYTVITPEQKISKNALTNQSRVTIAMGLSIAKEVRTFIESESKIDSDYPERLRNGFLTEYYALRQAGHRGDELFDLMCRFSQKGMMEQSKKSAGLAVLVYLFESCEVFEK